jgi:hypothetical protein
MVARLFGPGLFLRGGMRLRNCGRHWYLLQLLDEPFCPPAREAISFATRRTWGLRRSTRARRQYQPLPLCLLWVIRVRVEPAVTPAMSASLIGHSGSSTFRLSPSAVSMSLAGSCFSSESALGPVHHGIRGRGGTIYTAALPLKERQIQADMRTHLIHRPARDIFPPLGGALVFSYRVLS